MDVIPLVAAQNQTLKIVLGDQNCQIDVSQKEQGLFVNVYSNNVLIVGNILARESDPIVCRDYAGFVGNVVFVDLMGSSDPYWTGLGVRWQLIYLTGAEYEQFQQ